MKKCIKCLIEKPIEEFYKDKYSKDKLSNICKTCKKEYYFINKFTIAEKSKIRYINNKKERIIYLTLNKNKINKKHKEYISKNYIKIKNYHNNYNRKRKLTDINFKLSFLLRDRLNKAIKSNCKSGKTIELLGCSIQQFKEHLQRTAISNDYKDFNINNYLGKEYHIDHIVPCDAFNLECSYHQRLCFNWTNMQILKAKKNLEKSNKI